MRWTSELVKALPLRYTESHAVVRGGSAGAVRLDVWPFPWYWFVCLGHRLSCPGLPFAKGSLSVKFVAHSEDAKYCPNAHFTALARHQCRDTSCSLKCPGSFTVKEQSLEASSFTVPIFIHSKHPYNLTHKVQGAL